MSPEGKQGAWTYSLNSFTMTRGHLEPHADGTPAMRLATGAAPREGADEPVLTGEARVAGLTAGVPFHHPQLGHASP